MRNSIRKRLTLAFIGLAIGPLLLVGVIVAWQSFTTQEHQALNLQREMAQRVSTEVRAFSDGLESELRLVNQVQGLQKLDRNGQRDVLGELLAYQAAFESLDLLDSQGQEQVRLARSSVTPAEELGNRANADEFVIPQTTGRTYYSLVHFNEVTGEPFMTIAVPLLDVRTGLVDGVLVSEVRLQRIWDLIMELQTSPGQSVYIVDAQNKVIAHRNPSVVLVGTTFQVPDQDGIYPGLTGSSVVLVVDKVSLGGQTFYVVAEQTVAEALALAINTILITATLLVGALVISVMLGFVIVRQIVHPIQAMATTAQAISAGNLSRQVQITSRDEVGVLAAAFNSMTAQLRQSLESLEQQVVEVKQAEESLRQANETLQALIDHSPLAIMMLDLDNHILLWNNAAEKMYGWTAQEVLGEFSPYLPEDKREEQQVIRERVTQGEISTNLELERRRKDGSKIFIGASFAPLRDSTGSIYAFMSIAADITERKKAEQALWESEERLRQIASSLREVIWLRDIQTRQVLYVNPAFEELTGRTCESLYENRDIMIDSIHPDDREQVIKALDQRERVPYDKEHRILRLDGSVRWVSSRSVPVRNEAGEVYRWASIMEDITARKQAEEEIQRLNAELEQRVLERTAQLETANKELEAFSYSVSHDLRAPLRAIDGFSLALLEDYAGQFDAQGKDYLRRVRAASQRMEQLIDDLLALARVTRSEMHPTLVDLSALTQAIIIELQARQPERQVEFIIAPGLVVTADQNLVHIMLENLLNNAWKFTSKHPTARIELGMTQRNGQPVYFVRVDGAGFDLANAAKLFGAFQRMHSSAEFEGTGIGLATVQRIIHRHGGRVWAESAIEQGATFYFTLSG